MTITQGKIIIKELRKINSLLARNHSDWTDTQGAILYLRIRSARYMKYIREHFMSVQDYRKDGKYFEYKTSALLLIRSKMDAGEIIISKSTAGNDCFSSN